MTIAVLRGLLPLEGKLAQARWSGESAWIPLGWELDLGLEAENATIIRERESSCSTPRPLRGGDPLPVWVDLLCQQDGAASG